MAMRHAAGVGCEPSNNGLHSDTLRSASRAGEPERWAAQAGSQKPEFRRAKPRS